MTIDLYRMRLLGEEAKLTGENGTEILALCDRVAELEAAVRHFTAHQDDVLDKHEGLFPRTWFEAYEALRLATRTPPAPSVCKAQGGICKRCGKDANYLFDATGVADLPSADLCGGCHAQRALAGEPGPCIHGLAGHVDGGVPCPRASDALPIDRAYLDGYEAGRDGEYAPSESLRKWHKDGSAQAIETEANAGVKCDACGKKVPRIMFRPLDGQGRCVSCSERGVPYGHYLREQQPSEAQSVPVCNGCLGIEKDNHYSSRPCVRCGHESTGFEHHLVKEPRSEERDPEDEQCAGDAHPKLVPDADLVEQLRDAATRADWRAVDAVREALDDRATYVADERVSTTDRIWKWLDRNGHSEAAKASFKVRELFFYPETKDTDRKLAAMPPSEAKPGAFPENSDCSHKPPGCIPCTDCSRTRTTELLPPGLDPGDAWALDAHSKSLLQKLPTANAEEWETIIAEHLLVAFERGRTAGTDEERIRVRAKAMDAENGAFQAGWGDAIEHVYQLLGERFPRSTKRTGSTGT